MPEASFYLLPSQTELGRLQFACKLAEKAYRNGQFCYILTADEKQSKTLDDLLWTFRPGSFVPHAVSRGATAETANRILIGSFPAPEQWHKIIINLSAVCPENFTNCERILEILNDDATIKAEGRKRYKHYQQAGFQIATHKM